MPTNIPAEESPSQSVSDSSPSERRLEQDHEDSVASDSAHEQTTDLQGHLLAAVLRSMATEVDFLADGDHHAQDEERLATLHQDTVWVADVLNAWQAAAGLAATGAAPDLVSMDLQRLAREQTEAAMGPAARKGIRLQFAPRSASEVTGEPGLTERLVKAMISAALLVCRPNARLSVTVAESEGFVTCQVGATGEAMASQSESGQTAGQVRWAQHVESLRPLASAQAGRLDFDSPSGEAFELAFGLPAVQDSASTVEGTVLIVDDDPDGAFLLEQVLLKSGFHVRIAGNGLEGLSLARQEGIALILLDVMLPGMDGFEVCHRLREDPATANTPIVMISAKSRAEDREMGLQVGANAYMTKPLGMNDIVQTVSRFVTTTEEGSHDR
ncbi:MAG: response regulator [Anaerolineales bacterium]|jgi:CheY-like chemotaxis protein